MGNLNLVNCIVNEKEVKRIKGLGCLRDKTTKDKFNVRVITRNGFISSEEAEVIAKAARRFGSSKVAMTTRLTIEIQGVSYDNIEPLISYLKEHNIATGGTGAKVRPVVACKGTTCQYGLIDTYDLSNRIHEVFYEGYHDVILPHKFKIGIGGCPNNCIKPDLNDIGVVGQRPVNYDLESCKGCSVCTVQKSCPVNACSVVDGKLKVDEEICNNCGRCLGKCPFKVAEDFKIGYSIYIGGRWGKKVARGHKIKKLFESEEEVMKAIEKSILYFKEKGIGGERFGDTISRIGFENVEKDIISDSILDRKDSILNSEKKIDTTKVTC